MEKANSSLNSENNFIDGRILRVRFSVCFQVDQKISNILTLFPFQDGTSNPPKVLFAIKFL